MNRCYKHQIIKLIALCCLIFATSLTLDLFLLKPVIKEQKIIEVTTNIRYLRGFPSKMIVIKTDSFQVEFEIDRKQDKIYTGESIKMLSTTWYGIQKKLIFSNSPKSKRPFKLIFIVPQVLLLLITSLLACFYRDKKQILVYTIVSCIVSLIVLWLIFIFK